MWPFKKKPQTDQFRQDNMLVGSNENFHEYVEPFHMHWRRGITFDPGAAVYAYDTLALVPYYPINRFGRVQTPMRATSGPQLWVLPAATVYEMYPPTGQMISQPLIDPNAMDA